MKKEVEVIVNLINLINPKKVIKVIIKTIQTKKKTITTLQKN